MLCLICTPFVCGDQTIADANETSIFSRSDSLFGKQSTPIELADDNLGGSLYRMMLSLVIVIALAIGAMVASKKILPKISGISSKRVKVIETVSLGSRRAVHLLQIGNRKILIGSTQNTITRLADIPDEISDEGIVADETDHD